MPLKRFSLWQRHFDLVVWWWWWWYYNCAWFQCQHRRNDEAVADQLDAVLVHRTCPAYIPPHQHQYQDLHRPGITAQPAVVVEIRRGRHEHHRQRGVKLRQPRAADHDPPVRRHHEGRLRIELDSRLSKSNNQCASKNHQYHIYDWSKIDLPGFQLIRSRLLKAAKA